MLPKDLTKDVRTRLQGIKGQVDGLVRMLDDDRDPEQILEQFKAVQKGLDKAHYLLLDEVYRKALAIKIVNTVDACPRNCGNEDKIEFILKEFPQLKLDDLVQKMKEISALQERLSLFNVENSEEQKKT